VSSGALPRDQPTAEILPASNPLGHIVSYHVTSRRHGYRRRQPKQHKAWRGDLVSYDFTTHSNGYPLCRWGLQLDLVSYDFTDFCPPRSLRLELTAPPPVTSAPLVQFLRVIRPIRLHTTRLGLSVRRIPTPQ
jgi:hypothetical protein